MAMIINVGHEDSQTVLSHLKTERQHKYDPVKRHEYYMRTRKLKGRKKDWTKEINKGVEKLDKAPKNQIVVKLEARISGLSKLIKQREANIKKVTSRDSKTREEQVRVETWLSEQQEELNHFKEQRRYLAEELIYEKNMIEKRPPVNAKTQVLDLRRRKDTAKKFT